MFDQKMRNFVTTFGTDFMVEGTLGMILGIKSIYKLLSTVACRREDGDVKINDPE